MLIESKINSLLEKYNLSYLMEYLDNTLYLALLFGFLFLCLLFLFFKLFKNKNTKKPEQNFSKPNLEEIIERKEIRINDDNEFVDVLVAIEEEMLAVRELYVGGYISKGVYISETDRLYEKAKVFGL